MGLLTSTENKCFQSPLGKFAKNRGTPTTTTQPCFFNIILPKELRPLPCSGFFFWGVIKKSCVWVTMYGTPLFLPKMAKWQIFQTGCSTIFDCPVDRSWCAQRCCDGAATESLLRRRCADQLRRAHSARRVSRMQRAERGGWHSFSPVFLDGKNVF